jgi:hypothetical protein
MPFGKQAGTAAAAHGCKADLQVIGFPIRVSIGIAVRGWKSIRSKDASLRYEPIGCFAAGQNL